MRSLYAMDTITATCVHSDCPGKVVGIQKDTMTSYLLVVKVRIQAVQYCHFL